MTKKPKKIVLPEPTDGVDMERIKSLMGPLPDEENSSSTPTPKPKELTIEDVKPAEQVTPIVITKSNKAITDAANEVNASLKAMTDSLTTPSTTPVEPVEKIFDGDDSPVAATAWLDSMEGPEDGAALVVGEGVVADDPKIVDAVADIVAHESDTVLAAEDKARDGHVEPAKKPKQGLGQKLKALLAKPAVRWGIILAVLALIIGATVVPTSRYFVLNTAGVRSSISVTVIDSGTLQPLKNVTVAANGVSAVTDSKGTAKLAHIKLGSAKLQISKRAFTTISQQLTVGWGSNPLGRIRLIASGTKYSFVVTDFLSGKPIEKAEASNGDGNAASDKNGKIVISLDTSNKADTDELSIVIAAANYRTETVKISANNKEASSVKMVPSRKDVFMSNRSGKYDMFTIDVDGKNEKKIVSGTGIERPDINLAVQQNGDLAAYVATRENARNSDGYLLSTLYLVDTKSGNLTKIDQSEQIQLVGWSSDGHLVYVKIAAGASGANPKRYRLITINSKNTIETKEIATANAFNDVVMAGDKVLYAPSNALADNPSPGLFIVGADGTSSVTITSKETYNIFRTDYNTVTINASGTYYTYKIGAAPSTLTAISAPTTVNRLYIDGFGNNKSLWVDARDGKGLLLAYDKAAQKDTTLVTQAGLKGPIYWLNDTDAIFRVNDGKQTSDYIVNVNGGEARRIQDVNDTAGIGRWYYY